MLSDSDSEMNDLHTFTINEHFAKAFDYKKEREELAKLKEKYGSDYSESGSSDESDSEDTEEDSDGEELTPAMDAAILRTLARIRKKDPDIYKEERRVFEEEHLRTQDKAPASKPKTKEKSKRLTIREAALASALADADLCSRSPSPHPLTHTEEQALLRSETRTAFHDAVDPETQDDDDLLVPRARTRDEIELEEEEYKIFLEREVGEDIQNLVTVDTNEAIVTSEEVGTARDGGRKSESKKKKKGKKEREKEKAEAKGQSKKATKERDDRAKDEANQEFLMNYIFNRGWIDRSHRRVPTYDEIVESSSKQTRAKPVISQADQDGQIKDDDNEVQGAILSGDESFDELVDAFEMSYNFRYEEPGGALISSFPRGSLSARRESTTRKNARARKKQRLESEKQALLEERREEIRKERVLIEAAVSEDRGDKDARLAKKDASDRKTSKRQQRKEELARLRALKASELRRKLEMVSSEGGLSGVGSEALSHLDLDTDWDPSKYDAQMAELYGDDIVDDSDAKKPTWEDDINIDDIVPPLNTKSKEELRKQRKKDKKKKDKKADQDEDVGVDVDEMDANLGPGLDWDEDDAEWEGTEEERKRKVDAYMDEVVNRLGFSGITSHIPTRFHYTSVAPESYSLTPAEILLATDAELNSYVGLKKIAPYRVEKGGKVKKTWDPTRFQRLREFRESLHARVGPPHEGAWSLGINAQRRAAETQEGKKKRKGRKERAKLRAMQREDSDVGDDGDYNGVDVEVPNKPQKRKREPDDRSHFHASSLEEPEGDVEDSAPKKKRRRRHKKGTDGGEADAMAIL